MNFTRGGIIASVQTGTVTINSGSASGTANILPVPTQYSIVIPNGFLTSNTSFNASITLPALSLTNPTTVTASTAATDASNNRVVGFTVIEFAPWAIKSIQYGTITLNGTTVPLTGTATINSVDTANSFVAYRGNTYAAASAVISHIYINVLLTNATTVTARSSNGTNSQDSIVHFSVVEFNPNIIRSIQQVNVKIATSQTVGTTNINAVTQANCLTIFNGIEVPNSFIGTTSDSTRYPYAYISSATQVTARRGQSSGALDSGIYVTVIEFIGDFVRSVATNQTAIASAATQQSTQIGAVPSNKAILSYNWFNTSTNTGANSAQTFATIVLVSDVSAQQDRGASTNTLTQAWDIIGFNN